MIIGLTGGIASGKSTVSQMLQRYGATIIDADQVAREVVQPDEPTFKKLVQHFGKQIVAEDGTLDRKCLGQIVFDDVQKREQLNNITHPAIRERIQLKKEQAVQAGDTCIVLDIPLFFESSHSYEVDKVLVVYVPEDVQLERLMQRDGLDRERALKRIRSQLSIEKKKKLADAYVDNSGSIKQTEQQVIDLVHKWGVLESLKDKI